MRQSQCGDIICLLLIEAELIYLKIKASQLPYFMIILSYLATNRIVNLCSVLKIIRNASILANFSKSFVFLIKQSFCFWPNTKKLFPRQFVNSWDFNFSSLVSNGLQFSILHLIDESYLSLVVKSKVIVYKLCFELFYWNRIWDLGFCWADWANYSSWISCTFYNNFEYNLV